MVNPESIHPKSCLRHQMRRMLRGMPLDSKPVVRTLDIWLARRPHLLTLAGFSALPGEVDITHLISRHPDRRWVFPRVSGQDLAFHRVNDFESGWVSGAFGVMEPLPTLPSVAISDVDAFFCPGLAFDLLGGRLGRGKGFYDRMLANARPQALKIGVCFPCQIVTDTHSEPHDVHMDEVVSA